MTACPSCGQTVGHHVSCASEWFRLNHDPDDPSLYSPDGMEPQCPFITWSRQCRLDAGHSGLHSPGRVPEVRIHHGDPDSHARSFNQGWDEALRDAIRDIPEGVNDGWSRYDTDNTHVLSIHADGQTWDVIAPKDVSTRPDDLDRAAQGWISPESRQAAEANARIISPFVNESDPD